MEPRVETELDEAILMARYLRASGGLWPQCPRGPNDSGLQRTASSPVGSMDQKFAPEMAQSHSVSHKRSALSSEMALRPDFDAEASACQNAEESSARETAGSDLCVSLSAETGATARDIPSAPCMVPSTLANCDRRSARRALADRSNRQAQSFQPRVRVVDFEVGIPTRALSVPEEDFHHAGEVEIVDAPAAPEPTFERSRSGLRSGLSMLLNAPA